MPERKPAWAALNIHHEKDGAPVLIEAGEPIPDWVESDLVADWVKGGAASHSKPKGER